MRRYTFTDYGRWWLAPDHERFHAYYMLLRTVYHEPALEAYQRTVKVFRKHPQFMAAPLETIRQALKS